jgi:methylmalonyl-CoA mutase N-terminal domain/subunit
MLRFHTQTAGVSLQAQQIDTNVVRVTVQALAAILGGTQSLHTNARDEALALPTEESAKLALRTQQVLAYESGVADVVDPLAGSYFVESLTEQVEAAAWRYIEQIDALGGALAAIEQGFVQAEIQESAYRFQQEIERGDRVIVGVNRFADGEHGASPDILRVDPTVRDRQLERINAVKGRRDEAKARATLVELEQAARGTANTMERILACVEALCTLGEISDTLRGVFGEARELASL